MIAQQVVPITAVCRFPCDHDACAETRALAETPCVLCGQSIGYETPYCGNQHNSCAKRVIERIERELKAARVSA